MACTVLGVLTFLAFHWVTDRIVHSLGMSFAVTQALLEKSKLMAAIQPDLTLSLQMSDSPLLEEWMLDEDNESLKRAAVRELESYRKSFQGKSLFFVIGRSGHYYFSDGSAAHSLENPSYTLDPESPKDEWYFRVMKNVSVFELNVDYDFHLDVTKIWFNTVARDSESHKIGLCGTGIDITDFINEIIHPGEKGLETILISADGAIEGHKDKQYMIHNGKVRGADKKITVYDLMSGDADRAVLKEAIRSLSSGGGKVETFPVTLQGKRYLAAMSHLEEIKWFNLVLLDPGYVVNNRDFLPILVVTAVSMVGVLLIIGFLLNRRVLRPLSGLAEASGRMAVGDFDITIPIQSDDEIGTLARSFNEMAAMVKDHSENLERKVRDRTEELRVSHGQLAESNRQIMDSIRYARLIQVSMLPEPAVVESRARDFFVIYRPRDIVGGDIYFFRDYGDDFILSVIDCTGHGIPGAFMTMTAHAVLGHILDTVGHEDPAAILGALNRQVRESLHNDSVEGLIDNGLDIGLCRCNPSRGRVVFAGARMELHTVARGAIVTVPGDKQPIGYRSSHTEFVYTNHRVSYESETWFYMASDGILDQSGGPKGLGFGRKRFHELLTLLCEIPPAERKAAVERALATYQGDCPQRDDITMIGFRL